jgi:hypothetical protein
MFMPNGISQNQSVGSGPVHTDPDLAPADLLAVSADSPDDLIVHEVALSDLPGTWREIPAPADLQELGRSWIVGGKLA